MIRSDILPIFIGMIIGFIITLAFFGTPDDGVFVQYEHVFKFLTIAVGAGVGATVAFWYKKYDDKKEDAKKKVTALNKTLFILMRQLHIAKQLKNSMDAHLDKIRGESNGQVSDEFSLAMLYPPATLPEHEELKHGYDELNFLITLEFSQDLMNLMIEQNRFEAMLISVKNRNNVHYNKVQKRTVEIDNEILSSEAELINKIGMPLYQEANNAAIQMAEHINDSVTSLDSMHTKILKISKKSFPGTGFITY